MAENIETPADTPAPETPVAETAPLVDYGATDYSVMDDVGAKSVYQAISAEYTELETRHKAMKDLGQAVPSIESQRRIQLAEWSKDAAEAYKIAKKKDPGLSELPEDSTTDPGAPADTPTEAPAETPAETPAVPEAPAETPTETPAETPAETPTPEPEAELVAAGAPVGEVSAKPAGNTLVGFEAVKEDGSPIRSLEDMRTAFMNAVGGPKKEYKIASFNAFGSNENRRLGSSAAENFRTMYGRDTIATSETPKERVVRAAFGTGAAPQRNSYTAALNCKGPAEPIMQLPFAYTQGRPLADSGLVSMFESHHGQIQLYGCHQAPEAYVLVDTEDCPGDDCGGCDDMTGCFSATCIEPETALDPNRFVTCMCIPESLRFSNPIAFEQAMIDFAVANDIAWETRWMSQFRAASIVRTVDGSTLPEHGAMSTIKRAFATIAARKALNARDNKGTRLDNYTAFFPGGEELFYASMTDQMSRVLGCECPGEDLVGILKGLGADVLFGLDRDPDSPATAALPNAWDDETLGVAAPLESLPTAGSVFLIPRDTFGTSSPMQTEIGIDTRDQCSVHNGCLKMVRSEWWHDLFKLGCDPSFVLDFTALCANGTGPALTAPTPC